MFKHMIKVFLCIDSMSNSMATDEIDQAPRLQNTCNSLKNSHFVTSFLRYLFERHQSFLPFMQVFVQQEQAFFAERFLPDCYLTLLNFSKHWMLNKSNSVNNNIDEQPYWSNRYENHCQNEIKIIACCKKIKIYCHQRKRKKIVILLKRFQCLYFSKPLVGCRWNRTVWTLTHWKLFKLQLTIFKLTHLNPFPSYNLNHGNFEDTRILLFISSNFLIKFKLGWIFLFVIFVT